MELFSRLLPWGLAVLVLLTALVLLRRPLGMLLGLAVRTVLGLGALFALSQAGGFIGFALGVNLVNALIIGLLGVPGFGLLLMLNWTLSL